MLVKTASLISSALTLGAVGYAIGLPASRYFEGNVRMRLLISPAIGLGIFGAAGASIFHLLPFTVSNLLATTIFLSVAAVGLSKAACPIFSSPVSPSFSWIAVASVFGLLPMLTVIPQYYGAGASVGAPIFDHAKIAIIDEIAQNGLPPYNPYYSEAQGSNILIYYYIWYFLAASSSIITGAGGWEADIALTAVTALSSIFVVTWLAVAQSKRSDAAWWVLPLLLVGPLSRILLFISEKSDDWIVAMGHPRTWFAEAAWSPQHLFSATIVLIVITAYMRVLFCNIRNNIALSVLMGAMLATAYGSSMWAGGLSPLLVLPVIGLLSTPHILRAKRTMQVVTSIFVIAAVTVLCAGVLAYEQAAILETRTPVEFWIFPVFAGGKWFIDLPGFWLIRIIFDFGILFLSFVVWRAESSYPLQKDNGNLAPAVMSTVLVPFACVQFVHSVVMYNDLALHVAMPSTLLMMVITATVLSRHMGEKTKLGRLVTVAVVILLTPSILVGARDLYAYAFRFRVEGPETEETKAFRASSEMWKAVRRVTPPNDAVANNPLDLAELTFSPANISWAIMSQRRNCATSLQHLRAFAGQLSPEQASDIDGFFTDVFHGNITEARLKVMKEKYRCKTLVVTVRDGLWGKPLLDHNSVFQLVSEEKGKWRIYR
ncbi:hypothetical protein H0241_26840 [Mesorhizobium sp. CCANP35]|uniref:Glycosyltransferase RgtA/B/C/D-like domain-containing protein n=2 Tax=Mesorhizobium neociceri TaxID=1307853 RepID=A0A838BCS9_9HYPH|nr:hypothetical protein [Mesorhizobium neociceri]